MFHGRPDHSLNAYVVRSTASYLPQRSRDVEIWASDVTGALDELGQRIASAHVGIAELREILHCGYGQAMARLQALSGQRFQNGQSWASVTLEVVRWPLMRLESGVRAESSVEQTYFHLTPTSFLPSIRSQGLLPRRGLRSLRAKESGEQVFFFADVESVVDAIGSWVPQVFSA